MLSLPLEDIFLSSGMEELWINLRNCTNGAIINPPICLSLEAYAVDVNRWKEMIEDTILLLYVYSNNSLE